MVRERARGERQPAVMADGREAKLASPRQGGDRRRQAARPERLRLHPGAGRGSLSAGHWQQRRLRSWLPPRPAPWPRLHAGGRRRAPAGPKAAETALSGPALSGPALFEPALSGPLLSGPGLSGPALFELAQRRALAHHVPPGASPGPLGLPRCSRSGSLPRCPWKGRGQDPPCSSDRARVPARRPGFFLPKLSFSPFLHG
jgi:hypothetical protein